MFRFIKTTVAGGLLFILPLLLIAVVLEKALNLLRGPVHKLLPMFAGYDIAGVAVLTLVTLLVLILVCFFAGLLAKTAPAAKLFSALEEHVLGNLPGYQLLKDATARFAGMENVEGAKVGLLTVDEGLQVCLVLETQGHWLTVYVADGGPAGGTAGDVRLVAATQVILTDLPWLSVLACLRRGGRGLLELTGPWIPEP
ncbi:hypothetical protein [Pseudomonas purpurea]|uniref:hypothetical protein n=1 Tax=Pseudomonas purpurea TaxID=3136737 RepID=UPI0032642317